MVRAILLFTVAAQLLGQQHFQMYNTDNGLPQNSVLAMRQTRDGYLWFTTYRGLVRFDGVHFQVFDETNTPAIHGSSFVQFSLLEDHTGALWAATWLTGAVRYQHGAFEAFTSQNGLPDNTVMRIDEDAAGNVWLITASGLARYKDGRIQQVANLDGEPVAPYLKVPASLSIDSSRFGLWRFRNGHLQRFAYGKWSNFPLPPGVRSPASVHMDSLVEDAKGRLWFSLIGFPRKSFCAEGDSLRVFDGLPTDAFANYKDRQGRLWIADHKGQMAIWTRGRTTPVEELSTAIPSVVVEDREGGFWVGTVNQGLAHAVKPVITTIRLPGGVDANTIGPITEDAAGDIWAGNKGLTRLHAGSFRTYFRSHSPVNWRNAQMPSALWADPDGTIYAGYPDGIGLFKNGKFSKPEEPLRSIHAGIHAILRDRHGSLWVGSDAGLFLCRGSKLIRFDGRDELVRGDVRALYEDETGTVWVGTDKILCRYRGGFSCLGSDDQLSGWRVRSIFMDAQHVIWVAVASRGILRIDGTNLHWFDARDGLYASDATAIFEDSAGYFWVTCLRGVYRVRKRELNELAQARINRVSSTHFGKLEGLGDSDSTGEGQPHGFVARDGTIWLPTRAGLAHIDPQNVAYNNAPPPVEFESCSADGRGLPCGGNVILSPDSNNLEISYTALSLLRSNQAQFRYRLQGLSDAWTHAGTRRTAYFTRLRPGRYTFQVTAANSDGVWNPDGSKMAIFVQPHYYETLWFRALLAALIAGLFALAWHIRTIQFAKRQALHRAFSQQVIASQEAERKRIAAELHDGLGQRLALIKNLALLADGLHGEQHGSIQEISAEASQALSEVRQIAHDLRPFQLDLLGLSKAVELLAVKSCEAAGIRAHVMVDDLSGAFPKNSEIHFYRIVQECLNNIVKHSGAKIAGLVVQRTGAGISVSVSDDGKGFVPAQAGRNGNGGGLGLLGMRERVEVLGGSLTIHSNPGAGTVATMQFSLNGVAGISAAERKLP